MKGHVLWLPSDVIKILNHVIELDSSEATYSDYFDVIQPLLKQSAFKEQRLLICRLIESGMTEDEVACKLKYDTSVIKEIVGLKAENEYDYRDVNGVSLFSFEKNNIFKIQETTLPVALAEAIFLFAEGRITYNQARKISEIYTTQIDMEKYPMLGHKGINWFAKEILKGKGIVPEDYSWKHMECQ